MQKVSFPEVSNPRLAVAPHRVGLGNLRTRLKILHGDRSDLVLRPAEMGSGVEVIVTLPLKEA